MANNKFIVWCELNGLNPNYQSTQVAYKAFIKAVGRQKFLDRVINKQSMEVAL